jgi:hypothetical protein
MAFQSKVPSISARELEAQSVIFTCDLVAAHSNLAAVAFINGTIGATVITIDVGEPIQKCLCVNVTNRATGAVITHSAPDVSVANKISVTVDGTAQSDVCVEISYILA